MLLLILAFMLLYWGTSLLASSLVVGTAKTAIYQRILAAVVLFIFVLIVGQ